MKESILLALSDTNLTSALNESLSQNGYIVEIVNDGNDVIPRMKISCPNLLLIDTVMPNKSGYDILNEKSFDKDVTRIPVIIISNAGEPIQMKSIPATPVIKDYIVKVHVDPAEVIEKIEKVFGRGPVAKKIETPVQKTGNGKKVMWVEDDKLLSTILSRKFETLGYNLLKASNGVEALKILESETPNIIVLDIILPGGMNGVDILEKARSLPTTKNTPVIMLSNLNKQSDVEKAKNLGANKFLVKATVSLDEILTEVDKLIK